MIRLLYLTLKKRILKFYLSSNMSILTRLFLY
nr:MAG TPA: hypothetical protein [Caudoviricetes sp.]